MKTFDEALEYVTTVPSKSSEEEQRKVVARQYEFRADIQDNPVAHNLALLCAQAYIDEILSLDVKSVAELGTSIVTTLSKAYLSGLMHGVRVGVEMEKSE